MIKGLLAAITLLAIAGGSMPGQEGHQDLPKALGLDLVKVRAFANDLDAGTYGLVDSLLVMRCGKAGYQQRFTRSYREIYGDRAGTAGPLNHDVQGEYNYFRTEFHPYYRGSELHTMQSVSKTVTSVTIGAAMSRGDFPAD